MNDTKPSIVMITWSPSDYRLKVLTQSFASLRAHTPCPHTLVVIDNGPAAQTAWLRTQPIDVHLQPGLNLGVGVARNLGASVTRSAFIAFVDNDIGYFPGWLEEAVAVLNEYPNEKLIAAPRKSSPMKYPKYSAGRLGEYELYTRASGQCLVLRRRDFETIGPWSAGSTPGGEYCERVRRLGYRFIRHVSWTARHLATRPSYNFRNRLVNGQWVAPSTQESTT